MASGGDASLPSPLAAVGSTSEPLWPTWLSKPVILDFDGWKKIHIAAADFTYRPPANAAADAAAPSFSTADTIGFDTNRRTGSLLVDDIAWGGDDASDNGTVIDDFAKNSGTWRRYGSADALAAAVLSITSGDGRNGAGALKLDFAEHDASVEHSLTYLSRMIAAAERPYVVFVPNSPLKRETADALPSEGEASLRIDTFASPDQVQSASFTLYATKELSNVTVAEKVPLESNTFRFDRSAVDLSVVKFVKEHGAGPLRDADSTSVVPSILVKDDRVALSQTTATPITVRMSGDAVTDIPAHTQKQFWIKISVPSNAPAGAYMATLVVSGEQFKPFPITLAVHVLPLHLMSPSKQYAIGFHGKVGAPASGSSSLTDSMPEAQFAAELKDISAHGFRYVTLTDRGDDLWRAMDLYNAAGLGTPFLVSGFSTEADAEAIEDQKDKAKGNPFYYLPTNPDTLASDLTSFKGRGMKTATIVPDEDTLTKVGDNLDLVIYRADHPYIHKLLVSGGDRQSSKRDWLYWTSAQPDAATNRLYAGFLLWRANLYGAFASDYETSFGADPFDDSAAVSGPNAAFRPQMLTYPVQGGVLSTVQWEAIREGVTDVRYLTTFYAALRECKDNHVAKDTASEAEAAIGKFLLKPISAMSDETMQEGRFMIANYTVKLRKALDAYYAKHGGGA